MERDGVAEAFELRDEALGRAGGVATAVVIGPEVVVELAGAEHVPDGDEDGVLDGAGRFAMPDPRAFGVRRARAGRVFLGVSSRFGGELMRSAAPAPA